MRCFAPSRIISPLSATGEIRIMRAEPEDLPAIGLLAQKIWRAHYPGIISREQIEYMLARMYDLEVMRHELRSGINYDEVFQGNALAGFASYGPVHGELKLYKLYIDPARQRSGLGSAMLRHVETQGRNAGFQTLILTVNKQNQQAVAAYRKNGFTVRESVVVDIGGGFVMDDYVMAKPL